jgi:hypothetical protein
MWWRWKRYPGFGPWSDLLPWERPGWKFGRGRGRGWCWWYISQYPDVAPPDIPTYPVSKEEEIRMLEEEARFLEEELERIRKRLRELKGEK